MDCGPSDPLSPAEEDAQMEGAVLARVLIEHPSHMTIHELSRALGKDPDEFADRDAVYRAVRELVQGGLLHFHGGVMMPTRAARYFERLEMG
jgi:hypothetical protein